MECSAITIGRRRDESVEFWHHTGCYEGAKAGLISKKSKGSRGRNECLVNLRQQKQACGTRQKTKSRNTYFLLFLYLDQRGHLNENLRS